MESQKEEPKLLDQCIIFSVHPQESGTGIVPKEEFIFPQGSSHPARILNFLYPELDTPHKSITYSHRAFYFSLTNELGSRIFLTCKRSARWCVVVLSRSPWFDTSEYLLDTIWGAMPHWSDVFSVCDAASRRPASLGLVKDGEITLVVNYKERSPLRMTLPAQGNVAPTMLLRSLSLNKIMSILGALIKERRVLFISSDLHRLTACIWSMLGLLGPLQWQHVLIPVLPSVLINYCAAPMPFVLGILQDQTEAVLELPLEEVVFVYLDENKCQCVDVDDEILIPDTVAVLKNAISQAAVEVKSLPTTGSASVAEQMHKDFKVSALVNEAVDSFWVSSWVGQYRRFITRDPVKNHIVFDKANWIKSSPKRLHVFLEALSISQMWDHFILEREKLFEAGAPFPATSFETLVDRAMLQPIPDSSARIDGFKSFVKDRLDKAAKLALEFVSDDPHDQFVPPGHGSSPQPKPKPQSQPQQQREAPKRLAPVVPAVARSASVAPKSNPSTPERPTDARSLSSSASPSLRGQSMPSSVMRAEADKLTKSVQIDAPAPDRKPVSHNRSRSSSAAISFDLISWQEDVPKPNIVDDHPLANLYMGSPSPQESPRLSADLIDFSFAAPSHHPVTPPPIQVAPLPMTPLSPTQVNPLSSSNPFLDPNLFPPQSPDPAQPQWQPGWNPFAAPQ